MTCGWEREAGGASKEAEAQSEGMCPRSHCQLVVKQELQPQKAGLPGSTPTLSLPFYILEPLGKVRVWGEEGSLYIKVKGLCAPTSQGLSSYLIST